MNVKHWLIEKISEESGDAKDSINCDEIFDNLNLDSLSSISIAFDIEKEYNIENINPSVFSEYNTINKLAEWIQSRL